MLKVCIDIYCIFGIGTAHRGNSQKVRDNERQDPSGISGFLLTILVDKSPNLHGPSEASHLRSAQAGHVLLPFERAAHQSLRGGPAIRDDPPNRNLRMPKRNWVGIIYIIYICVCVFSYDMIN